MKFVLPVRRKTVNTKVSCKVFEPPLHGMHDTRAAIELIRAQSFLSVLSRNETQWDDPVYDLGFKPLQLTFHCFTPVKVRRNS